MLLLPDTLEKDERLASARCALHIQADLGAVARQPILIPKVDAVLIAEAEAAALFYEREVSARGPLAAEIAVAGGIRCIRLAS